MGWFYLGLAIVFELSGTIAMKESHGFTRLWPSITVFIFYSLCLGGLTLAMNSVEMVTVYSVWAGMGTAVISAVGMLYYKEPVTILKVFSIFLIIAGVMGLVRTSS